MEYRVKPPGKTKHMLIIAMFTSMAMVTGFIESRFPLPFPGMRLGIANIFPLTALILYGPAEAISVAGLRLALSFFLSGNIVALSCSAGGIIVSLPLSIALYEYFADVLSVPAISVASAFAFNAGQLGAIALLLGSWGVLAYLPPLLLCAAATGYAIGSLASMLARKLSSGKQT
ncbi:MAG: Gx transporter family protein [Synergistaceae bacterium]|jgi:heptaprenyl diphosphate synthase|nr:Gx transporter family protein [Synergistaceae bacterium]